jgi:HEPN domain-containing protein
MTPGELRCDEAGRWLLQACKDLIAAQALVALEPSRFVFHSQQAAEKAAKAFLACYHVPFRKSHDSHELGQRCVLITPSLAPLLAEVEDLTDYAIVFRYLDAPREPDEREAEAALLTARKLDDEIDTLLKARGGTGSCRKN